MANNQGKKKKQKEKKPEIRLRKLSPHVHTGRDGKEHILAGVEAMYFDAKGKLINDATLGLFTEGQADPIIVENTENGIAIFCYEASLNRVDQVLGFVVRDIESGIEQKDEFKFTPTRGALSKVWRCIKYNYEKKKARMLKYVGITGFIFLFALFFFGHYSVETNVIVGSIVSAIVYFKWLKEAGVRGLVVAGILLLSFILPIFSSPLIFASVGCLLSLFMYVYEAVTYKFIEKTDEGGEKQYKWEKEYNYYPNVPLGIASLGIIINLFLFISALIPDFGGSEFIEQGKIYSNDEFWGGDSFVSVAHENFKDIIDWLAFIVVLLITSGPQEFLAFVRGEKKLQEAKIVLEKGFFWKEAFDMFGWIAKLKK